MSHFFIQFRDDDVLVDPLQPVFETPPTAYTAEGILRILLDPQLKQCRICQERPTSVTRSATFVVDVTKLHHPDDIKKDTFGKWNHSGSHTIPFHIHIGSDDDISIEKCAPGATGSDIYYLRRLHSTHPSNPEFKRLIALISGNFAHFFSFNLVCDTLHST